MKDNSKGVQTFSHERHYILSSELKHLYVAVTRAKQRLLICDEKNDYIEPIRKYWKSHIKNEKVDENYLSTLAEESDSREWDEQGKDFFEQRQYEQVGSFLK